MALSQYTVTVIQKIQLTRNVIELRFEKPTDFDYTAGQFIQVLFTRGEKNYVRSYSLSSIPTDDYLECCIKVLPEGVGSNYLNDLSIGDRITIRGPVGNFTTKHTANSPLFCIATGVGIAPIMSIITHELRSTNNTRRAHVLFGVRSETDIFWLERLETMKRDYSHFSYTLTLSQPSTTWDATAGRVTNHLSAINTEQDFFVCGSLEMVKDVRRILQEQQVAPHQIHAEIF